MGETNRVRIEEFDTPTLRMFDQVEGVTNEVDFVSIQMEELARSTVDTRRALEEMRIIMMRLERRSEGNNHVKSLRHGRRNSRASHAATSSGEEWHHQRPPTRDGGRIECDHEVVERWLHGSRRKDGEMSVRSVRRCQEERRRGQNGEHGRTSDEEEPRRRPHPQRQRRHLEDEDFEDQRHHGSHNQRP